MHPAGVGADGVYQPPPLRQVFIAFHDHGGGGLLAFPSGDYLYADELSAALHTMHAKHMYREVRTLQGACHRERGRGAWHQRAVGGGPQRSKASRVTSPHPRAPSS